MPDTHGKMGCILLRHERERIDESVRCFEYSSGISIATTNAYLWNMRSMQLTDSTNNLDPYPPDEKSCGS